MGSKGSSSCGWTNERHVDFLNSMEASFVRTILQNNLLPPLDRYLPDSSDSTLDLNTQRRTMARRRHSTPDILESSRFRTDKRNRRLLHQPYTISSSQDQVVPQFESGRADDNDTDKKDRRLDVTPAN